MKDNWKAPTFAVFFCLCLSSSCVLSASGCERKAARSQQAPGRSRKPPGLIAFENVPRHTGHLWRIGKSTTNGDGKMVFGVRWQFIAGSKGLLSIELTDGVVFSKLTKTMIFRNPPHQVVTVGTFHDYPGQIIRFANQVPARQKIEVALEFTTLSGKQVLKDFVVPLGGKAVQAAVRQVASDFDNRVLGDVRLSCTWGKNERTRSTWRDRLHHWESYAISSADEKVPDAPKFLKLKPNHPAVGYIKMFGVNGLVPIEVGTPEEAKKLGLSPKAVGHIRLDGPKELSRLIKVWVHFSPLP